MTICKYLSRISLKEPISRIQGPNARSNLAQMKAKLESRWASSLAQGQEPDGSVGWTLCFVMQFQSRK
ncbi:hypothetical protein OIDMADRAFT_16711 [Oidiodendron maius Zn]|uniref:Uncharacterized protein n=1 Tax=Oidiodendron maius (strain Zn) TaxID=913774 RepID=A0A0C3I2J5_OIDMZ|nr:hypothetical protein OIDMADRAFT_16711 [Oidiodendron maius Zn]